MSDDPNSPTVLIAVPDETQAGLIVNALAEYGIEAAATGDYTSGFRAEAPGRVEVVVKQSDLSRAKRALQRIRPLHNDIEWSQIDVGEPEES